MFDNDTLTSYCIMGFCNIDHPGAYGCGLYAGFYFTMDGDPFILTEFQIATGTLDMEYDPVGLTIEGSNHDQSELHLGSSWTLIYRGLSGLFAQFNRASFGRIEKLVNITTSYRSFRFIIISKGGSSKCTMISEFRLFGFFVSSIIE